MEYGYFDDLLIGNFMKVRLVNTKLYPQFTPLVAKIGGNAKVYTRDSTIAFVSLFRRNPVGMGRIGSDRMGSEYIAMVPHAVRTSRHQTAVEIFISALVGRPS